MLVQLKEGWTYVSGFAPIRTILLLFAVVSLMGWPFTVLMPIFAAKVLKGGPHTLGFLMGAMGVGALVSAVSLAVRRTVLGLGRMIPLSAGAFGIGLIFFGMSRNLWMSLALMLVCGFGLMQQMAASNTIIQTIVEESKRGRVMSFYTMAFVGMAPFGSLLGGQPGPLNRRAEDGDADRDVLRGWSDLVLFAPADDSAADPANLRGPGNIAASRRSYPGQRGALRPRATVEEAKNHSRVYDSAIHKSKRGPSAALRARGQRGRGKDAQLRSG